MGDRWLLDANVVSMLFQEGCEGSLASAAGAGIEIATTETVLVELGRVQVEERRPWTRRLKAWSVPAGMARLDMVLGDEASTRFDALRGLRAARRKPAPGEGGPPAASLKDHGELTCIAHAAADPTLVLVAHDRNALWWAVHELYPHARLGSVAGFVRCLCERGCLTRSEAGALGRNRDLKDHLPTWWAALIG